MAEWTRLRQATARQAWKRGPAEPFTGWRWNGVEWNRLELAKSGPNPSDVSLEVASGDSSAVKGSQGSRWRIPASVGIILAMETVPTARKWNNISCVPVATMLFIMRSMR